MATDAKGWQPMDNIPEFGSEYDHMKAHYDRLLRQEQARHGASMFAAGVIEGLRQAVHAIKTDKDKRQPSGKWLGMNAAIAAVEDAIAKAEETKHCKAEEEEVQSSEREEGAMTSEKEKRMCNIPEFHESDSEWESGEYGHLKKQWDRITAKDRAPIEALRAILQRVADFDFMSTLDATPTPAAREAYTRLMVDVRLALREEFPMRRLSAKVENP